MTTYNLGTLNSTPVEKDNLTVTSAAPNDVFSFEINGTKNINLGLDSQTGNTNLRLYQDTNGNGVLDNADQLVETGNDNSLLGGGDEGINFTATAGKYLAQVTRGNGLFNPATHSYDLKLSATAVGSASNVLPAEVQVGAMAEYNTKTFTGTIDATNTADVYAFSTPSDVGADIRLTGLSANANIRLVKDLNSNGLVDASEVQGMSTRLGSASEMIKTDFGGNYLLQVYQVSGNTNYSLQISTFDAIG